jgi:hypothetical protein
MRTIRLGPEADRLVAEEIRRSGHSRSVVVEELTEEAAKTRLHPGIAFRGKPRRAWVIGSGLDVWEIVELERSYQGDEDLLRESHPLITRRHLHTRRSGTRPDEAFLRAPARSGSRPDNTHRTPTSP